MKLEINRSHQKYVEIWSIRGEDSVYCSLQSISITLVYLAHSYHSGLSCGSDRGCNDHLIPAACRTSPSPSRPWSILGGSKAAKWSKPSVFMEVDCGGGSTVGGEWVNEWWNFVGAHTLELDARTVSSNWGALMRNTKWDLKFENFTSQ